MASKLQLTLTLVMVSLETFLYTGVFYGWASVRGILMDSGYFKSEQTLSNVSLSNSTEYIDQYQVDGLNLVYTVTSSATPVALIFVGMILDSKGIWFTRTFFLFTEALGFLLIALVNPSNSYVLFVAMPCINIGGFSLFIVNCLVGNLFPTFRSTIQTFFSGCFVASTITFLVINILYHDYGLSLRFLFTCAALLSIPMHLTTFFLFPKDTIPRELPVGFEYGLKGLLCSNKRVTSFQKGTSSIRKENEPEFNQAGAKIGFKKVLFSKAAICDITHFNVVRFSSVFFIGNYNIWIEYTFPGQESENIDRHLRLYSLIRCCGVVTTVVCGLASDQVYKSFNNKTADSETTERDTTKTKTGLRQKKAGAWTLVMTSLLFVCFYASALVPHLDFQILTYILSVLCDAAMYGTMGANLASNYPSQHFGKMYGVISVVGGLFLLMQFPLTSWIMRLPPSAYKLSNCVFLITSLFSAALPCTNLWHLNKEELRDARCKSQEAITGNSDFTEEA